MKILHFIKQIEDAEYKVSFFCEFIESLTSFVSQDNENFYGVVMETFNEFLMSYGEAYAEDLCRSLDGMCMDFLEHGIRAPKSVDNGLSGMKIMGFF